MSSTEFNVRDFGAQGDGVTLDSPAINAAIAAAAAAGGGTVRLPAGTYLSYSIRLRSQLTLHLDAGATLLAATPSAGAGGYDAPEPNDWGDVRQYQDFGHSHWHNSLIWGEGLENIAITGTGRIDGRGLVKNLAYGGGPRDCGPDGTVDEGARPPIVFAPDPIPAGAPEPAPDPRLADPHATDGYANKAIGLKLCRNVTLRDFSLLNGGHFALLATGVDNLTIDGLRVDTNRDGLDIDTCRNVRIINCSVNAPNDDAIVLKSSYALGEARPCENVTIVNCFVSGFDIGSLLDGSFRRTLRHAPDLDGPTGRIKLGTESSGGFRNIAIVNCVFERSRGLALETVDGGVIEDVVVSNLAMREIANAPIFLRLGARARGPKGTPVGAIRRVQISQVSVSGADGRFPILLAGLPDHPIEDVVLDGVQVQSRGGITLEQVRAQPAELVNSFFLRGDEPGVTGPREPLAVPLRAKSYPEPSMFGLLPASALYARDVKNLTVRDVSYGFAREDARPRVVLERVSLSAFDGFRAAAPTQGEAVVLRDVSGWPARPST
ncbi:rhamnogalacturonidase [Opitutus terrae]|uniref:Glycoside hydrolase family 28 n=1 Tax=Opitutus terrae (strain DSM 11246 / JCM 15787 / PB90-1) TaxID=452637 RepID=B1ZNM4_OPITP|nr:glycosyl hydrolase family 28-related protein [Opitutus terrae]ACB74458.1 glycoside hydrolase family 28 [Opitutus terrae PB90-1]